MGVDPASLAITVALNAAAMAMTASQTFEGPRLDSLGVTTSDYGTPIPYAYGTKRLFGVSCLWAEPLTEVKQQNKTKGGKYNEYKYFGTWAVILTDHEIEGVTRIWFDKHLIYDVTGAGPISPIGLEGSITDYMRIYLGTATQEPDPRIQATIDAEHGEGSTPAYRHRAYIVFEEVPLEKLGNRLPQVDVEVVAVADAAFPFEEFDTEAAMPFSSNTAFGFSPDRSRMVWAAQSGSAYEIWDVAARSAMISGTLNTSEGSVGDRELIGVSNAGKIYILANAGLFQYDVVEYPADGIGTARQLGSTITNGEFIQVIDTAWGEYVCVSRRLTSSGGYVIDLVTETQTYVDPLITLGRDARVKFFFADLDGELWAVCGHQDLGATEIAFIKVTGAAEGHVVTLPSTVGSTDADLYAYHYRDSDVDHFVVARAFSSGNDWALVDTTSWTVTSSAALGLGTNEPHPYAFVRPGAAHIYFNERRISSKDLSVVTWDLEDWDPTESGGGGGVYDPINHAIFKEASASTVAWFYLDRIGGDGVTLRSIFEDVAARCGLSVADDIDATALNQVVAGYSWVQGQGKAVLEPLLEFHNSEVRPHDFKLQAIKRGVAAGGTIPVSDMGAGGSARYVVTRTLDTDLPLGINVNFADPAMDQQPNSARSQRHAEATDGKREQSLDVTTLVADIDDARSAADGYLRRAWFSAEAYELSVTREYTALEPGDVQTLTLDDVTRTAKLAALEFGANGVLTSRWVRDAASAHVAQVQPGAPADGFVPSEILVPAYSRGFILDIPLAQDSHEGLILYMAAGPYSDEVTWAGATVYESLDDGDSFSIAEAVTSAQQAIWGVTTEALPDALATVWDRASSLNVRVHSGTLTSVTEAQAENGSNLALIGDELVHFTTATLQGDGTYEISGFLRGRRGTEQHTDAHAAGDRFVLLSPSVRHTMGVSDLTDAFVYRTVSAGNINLTGFDEEITFAGASLKPYSPAHLQVVDSSGDKVVTWVRRTRLGGFNVYGTTPPLGESAEAYVGQILDGGGNVIRSFAGLSSPTFTYTAAQQATDGSPVGVTARVMQVSTTVGNGFPADAALAA